MNSGSVSAHYEYDPFGRLVCKEGSYADENEYRFSTKRYCSKWGLYDYGYRHYSTDLGRWMSRDLIEENYLYLNNNAPEDSDYLGLMSLDIVKKPLRAIIRRSIAGAKHKAMDIVKDTMKDIAATMEDKQRQMWYNAALKWGNITEDLPRRLLHNYIWQERDPFIISPEEFTGLSIIGSNCLVPSGPASAA